jgi:hypothetical protein
MTSPGLRSAIKAELAARWSACPVFDLSDYISFAEIPQADLDCMLLLQFTPSTERIATIGPPELHSWREQGVIYFHLAMPTGEPSARALTLGEELRALFRNRRIGAYRLDFFDPFSDFAGAAIKLDGRWHGWSAPLGFTTEVCA